jgi:hypothetical protein
MPNLEDLFSLSASGGESEPETELVLDVRRLGGVWERLPPNLPTLINCDLPTGDGESSEEDVCSGLGRGGLCNAPAAIAF